MERISKGIESSLVLSLSMLSGLTFLGAILAAPSQGDVLDGDRVISSIEYHHADINEVLRTLLREVNADYVVEPGVSGSVSLSLRNISFTATFKQVLNQVSASSSCQRGVFFIEDAPNLPEYEEVMNRKLPNYDFSNTKLSDALTVAFNDAKVRATLPTLPSIPVGRKFQVKTLRQVIDSILPLTNCRIAYRRGRFEFIPKSVELLPGYLLDRQVSAIDFLDVSPKDAFSTLFRQVGAQYVLGPNIDARFTMKLQSRKFEEALDILCQATDTTYQLHGEVFQIERRK